MLVRVSDWIVPVSRILKVDCYSLETQSKIIVHVVGEQPIELVGAEAIDLVMRLNPSYFEGRRFRWVRHGWIVHNLIGHPLLQVLAWMGRVDLGLRVHDATIPRPTHKS